jgi:hypothetical protein
MITARSQGYPGGNLSEHIDMKKKWEPTELPDNEIVALLAEPATTAATGLVSKFSMLELRYVMATLERFLGAFVVGSFLIEEGEAKN